MTDAIRMERRNKERKREREKGSSKWRNRWGNEKKMNRTFWKCIKNGSKSKSKRLSVYWQGGDPVQLVNVLSLQVHRHVVVRGQMHCGMGWQQGQGVAVKVLVGRHNLVVSQLEEENACSQLSVDGSSVWQIFYFLLEMEHTHFTLSSWIGKNTFMVQDTFFIQEVNFTPMQ